MGRSPPASRMTSSARPGTESWRRLFTAPGGNSREMIVGGDPTARRFTGWLAKLLKLRDGGICREPYCGAPIRHLDHITPYRDGGPTTYANGRGVCNGTTRYASFQAGRLRLFG